MVYLYLNEKSQSKKTKVQNPILNRTLSTYTKNEKISIIILLKMIAKKSLQYDEKNRFIENLIILFNLKINDINIVLDIGKPKLIDFLIFNFKNLNEWQEDFIVSLGLDMFFQAGIPSESEFESLIEVYGNFTQIYKERFIEIAEKYIDITKYN